MAGTTVPRAHNWWCPDTLASMTLEKSSSFHIFWYWGPQVKPSSWECSLLGISSGCCGQVGISLQERGEALGGTSIETKPLGVCSGTFHSNSQPRKPTLSLALVAWEIIWVWKSAAALWTFFVTTTWPPALTITSVHQTSGAVNDSCLQERFWSEYCRKITNPTDFQKSQLQLVNFPHNHEGEK